MGVRKILDLNFHAFSYSNSFREHMPKIDYENTISRQF